MGSEFSTFGGATHYYEVDRRQLNPALTGPALALIVLVLWKAACGVRQWQAARWDIIATVIEPTTYPMRPFTPTTADDTEGFITGHRDAVRELEAATDELAKAEWQRIVKGMRTAWKEW